MEWFEGKRYRIWSRSALTIDAFSLLFSYYAVPVAIGILSLFVLLYPAATPEPEGDIPLSMRILSDPGGHLDVESAAAALRSRPLQTRYDTHLSEAPVWFEVNTFQPDAPNATTTLFPSRHIQQITCFDAITWTPIGSVSRTHASSGEMTRSGNGIALVTERPQGVICRAIFSGPAVLSASHLSLDELKRRNDTFYRRSGLLEGGLVTLAAFVLITAIVNRDWVYVLFAAWLFGNLRLGAISMGWDDQWLGYSIPLGWISLIRKITVPVYYILTCTLFQTLFKNDLLRVGYQRLFQTVLCLGPLLLLAAILLPVPLYLPVMWGIASFAIAVLVFTLARLLAIAPSRTALWYSAAMGVALLASLSEVASAAFKTHLFFPALNSVTAALVSSLMAALAIAEQIRAERAERLRVQAELRHAYEATPVGLFTLASDGSFVRWNTALETMLNMEGGKAGRHWNDYFAPDSWQLVYNQALNADSVEVELSRESNARAADPSALPGGLPAYEGVVAAPRSGGDKRRHYLVKAAYASSQLEGSIQDVTERHQALNTLSFLAEHDPLTGALNRRGIDKNIGDTENAAADSAQSLVIAYLDLDRFKLINDLFGHHIGDEVLKQVCLRIESQLRPSDCVCRIGGDEFVILFGKTPVEQAATISQTIVDVIDREPYRIGRRAFHVRASLGLIESPPAFSAEEAISTADAACREAKLNGNGRIVVYTRDAPMFVERARDLNLIERFNGELPLAGLFLEMQPIMSLKTPYDALDFEVLLRMRAPDGTIIPPAKAIAAAEANGTISALDKWVMETTLSWIDQHRAKLSHTRFISINVSGASLNDEHFVAELSELLHRYRAIVPMLCIEITEGVALHDLDNTRRLVDNLQRLGAKVALDDFGAGYTSFPYLRDLPADALKIDGGFVRDMQELSANAAIVEAIIGLARNLGMQSIAEWVENAQTLEVLLAMRVDYVQGFAIARPQSPDVILAATSAADFIKDPEILALIGPRIVSPSLSGTSTQALH
ncbi:putative bifunctional diguanylate cyclase/phosphodiesterase [Paraburkholderia fungorum]|uniref:putative bifunctional diguanylate cyclase/phosphodiesterase n=1 Tax=Paraburkholderia fungorum TaxID=134537 RepID=UPI0038BB6C9A